MSEAMNIFMNSYLKKMKRPEMGEGFSPDQAFGANMVRGSESLNPDSLRDRTNAQYGGMKGPSYQGSGVNIPGMGSVQNMPFMGANKSTPFADMMNQTAKVVGPNIVSPWLTEKLKSLLAEKPSDMVASTMRLPMAEAPTDVMLQSLKNISATDSGLGGITKVGEEFSKNIPVPSELLNTPVKVLESAPGDVGLSMGASTSGPIMESLTGSKTAGDVTGAATATGLAAAQGGMNPISDLAAIASLYKLIRGLF